MWSDPPAVPRKVTGISALLTASARRYPRQAALTIDDRDLSYGELLAGVESLAKQLSDHVSFGQRVGIIAPNVPALAVGLFAVWQVGGVAVPIHARNREYELRGALRDAGAVAVVSVDSYLGYSFAELLRRVLPELPLVRHCWIVDAHGTVQMRLEGTSDEPPTDQDAPLGPEVGLILYSSGTMGTPKGALITHQSEVVGASAMNEVLAASPRDVCLFVIPISHAFGLTCLLGCIASGGRAVLVDSTFSLEPLVRNAQQHNATILHGSPTLFTSLLKTSWAPNPGLRAGFVAGAACPPGVLERLDEAGLRVLNLYGMTELGAVTCCRRDDSERVRYTTVGRPLSSYQIRTVGNEVQVSGPHAMPGYYRHEDQNADAFDGSWFRTGDLGQVDAAGNLTINGRAKDVIHVGGNSVFPAEVEGFFLTHPAVERVAVAGAPHATMGETVVAFVVPRAGTKLTATELLQFARPRMAGYKLPYMIRFLSEIPSLSTGKPDRAALLRLLGEEGR